MTISTATPTVLFWDIDGTLLTTARAGIFALEEAAREVCGENVDLSAMKTAGMTDAKIAEAVVERHFGAPDPARAVALLRAYERHLPERLHWRRGEVLPGVVEILEALRGRSDVVSLLLTGNTAAGAAAKLAHYGLADLISDGAFCGDDCDRPTVARRAVELARRRIAGEPGLMYVIGDTPADVACGKAIGARTVAVASGPGYSMEELAAADPWLLLERLPEPARFLELLELA